MITLNKIYDDTTVEKQRVILSVESVDLFDYAQRFKSPNVIIQHGTLSTESQQLDNSEREAMLDRVRDTIDAYDQRHPKTGPMQIYLMDGRVMGSPEDTAINGLIASCIRNPQSVVAALIPEDAEISKPADLAPGTMLRRLADHVLATDGARCVVGRHALESFMAGDESVAFAGEPSASNESVPLNKVAFTGASIAAVAAALYGLVRIWKGARARAAERAEDRKMRDDTVESVERMIVSMEYMVRHNLMNPQWVKQQTFAQEKIHASDLIPYITVAHHIPADLASAIRSSSTTVEHYVSAYTDAVVKFSDEVVDLLNKVGEDPGTRPEYEVARHLGRMHRPDPAASFPTSRILGTLSVKDIQEGAWHRDRVHEGELNPLTAKDLPELGTAMLSLLHVIESINSKSSEMDLAVARMRKRLAQFRKDHLKKETRAESTVEYDPETKTAIPSMKYVTIVRGKEDWARADRLSDLGTFARVIGNPMYNLAMFQARSLMAVSRYVDRCVEGKQYNTGREPATQEGH